MSQVHSSCKWYFTFCGVVNKELNVFALVTGASPKISSQKSPNYAAPSMSPKTNVSVHTSDNNSQPEQKHIVQFTIPIVEKIDETSELSPKSPRQLDTVRVYLSFLFFLFFFLLILSSLSLSLSLAHTLSFG